MVVVCHDCCVDSFLTFLLISFRCIIYKVVMSLMQQAADEYAMLSAGLKQTYGGRSGVVKGVQALPDDEFDFLTSVEMPTVPIHVVEVDREESRRRGVVDRETSKQEFVAQLGIAFENTCDPDSGRSVLEVSEAVRAYYGDPMDEAYRVYRFNLMRVTGDNSEFLKVNSFLAPNVQKEYEITHPDDHATRWPEEVVNAKERHFTPARRELLKAHRAQHLPRRALAAPPKQPWVQSRLAEHPYRSIAGSYKAQMLADYANQR